MKVLIKDFIKQESSAGILLIFVTICALALRNSPLSQMYYDLIHVQVTVMVDNFSIDKPLFLWINDGLMAIFFLVVGLEVKRELIAGHLSSWSKISLPAIAAIGGMVVPASIFIAFNYGDSQALRGWAIPTATDIAFALGILALLGSRIPASLKIFLMALAIIDDIGAILIIALFYTVDLSTVALLVAFFSIIALIIMNRFGVVKIAGYVIIGIILWTSLLKSGVHATLSGIILAMAIPLSVTKNKKLYKPADKLRHNLHFWVTFLILPLFAFVNAGVDLKEINFSDMLNSVPLGISTALFIGKPLGVFTFVYVAVKFKWAVLPKCVSWTHIFGVSILTGIGFTMSLFINSLAFTDETLYMFTDKLSILIGSFLAGIFGYIVLRFSKRKRGCRI